jgi:tRNA(fMet)-specific endonuclease VapC
MLRFLLDTDHLSHYQAKHPLLLRRLGAQPGEFATSVVSAEEALRGRLASVAQAKNGAQRTHRYQLFQDTLVFLRGLPVLPYDQASEAEFQRILHLRTRCGTQDLKVAAIAVANQLTLLTCNRRHFAHVPVLAIDDWTV